jgi:2-polyprenyl-6-hydroxyphenyl methylase / 3-demethylubiquinone-9 3-methyltransferase
VPTALQTFKVVEHTPNPDEFVRNCASLVKPGGGLVMSTMNRNMKSWGFAILGAEYLGRLLPVGTHEWRKFRTPDEMRAAMTDGGLVVKDTSGIVFDPKALRPLSSPQSWKIDKNDIDVNYIVFAKRDV